MKTKTKIKVVIDVLMTLTLLFVSGYQLWGDVAHEIAGAVMLVLFIAHNLLNLSWYAGIFKGRYTPRRILGLVINILVLAVMLLQMYSGITLSRYVFEFLPIEGGLAAARRLHILGAYWGFLLMNIHLGLHWSMVIGMVKKAARITQPSKLRRGIAFALSLTASIYGVFVFIKRDFLTYMLLQSEFVFLDYEEPIILFYLDYIALMSLCIFIAHYASVCISRLSKPKTLPKAS